MHILAAQAFGISVTHAHSGSVLTSVGRWLDRGINKLIGSGPPSNTSTTSDAGGLDSAAANQGLRMAPGAPSPAGTAPSSPRVGY